MDELRAKGGKLMPRVIPAGLTDGFGPGEGSTLYESAGTTACIAPVVYRNISDEITMERS
jgi:hypothetical protein